MRRQKSTTRYSLFSYLFGFFFNFALCWACTILYNVIKQLQKFTHGFRFYLTICAYWYINVERHVLTLSWAKVKDQGIYFNYQFKFSSISNHFSLFIFSFCVFLQSSFSTTIRSHKCFPCAHIFCADEIISLHFIIQHCAVVRFPLFFHFSTDHFTRWNVLLHF